MILIISDRNDHSTNEVIDWLCYCKEKFYRINREDELNINELLLHDNKVDFEIEHSNKIIKLSKLNAYWYRRGYLNFTIKIKMLFLDKILDKNIIKPLYSYLNEETNALKDSVYEQIYQLKGFGKFHENDTNKFTNLFKASLAGLEVPCTLISNKQSFIKAFAKKFKFKLITKAVDKGGFHLENGYSSYANTSLIDDNKVLDIEEGFFYSLLQENILKKYELRIFYLDGKLFSSVIFSQNDPQTRIDFRNYNGIKPNRVVPFKISAEIENKIIKFMRSIDMKSGSIDLVVSQINEYIFLEVNPIGQFQQVSLPCNYLIEKNIAQYLSNN